MNCAGCASEVPQVVGLGVPIACGKKACVEYVASRTLGPYMLEVEPISWKRPRPRADHPAGKLYTPGAHNYRIAIAQALILDRVPRRNEAGPFALDVTFTVANMKRCDGDNLEKSFVDAIVALDVISDDAWTVLPEVRRRVRFDAVGSIVFSLTRLEMP